MTAKTKQCAGQRLFPGTSRERKDRSACVPPVKVTRTSRLGKGILCVRVGARRVASGCNAKPLLPSLSRSLDVC